MEKTRKSRPRDGDSAPHILNSQFGDVNFKIVPEASVFRGDADFEGPGAQKYHFWIIWRFLENNFEKYVPEKNRDRFLSNNVQQYFPGKWGWGQLWFWGSGPENYSPDLPPDF